MECEFWGHFGRFDHAIQRCWMPTDVQEHGVWVCGEHSGDPERRLLKKLSDAQFSRLMLLTELEMVDMEIARLEAERAGVQGVSA